MSIAKAHFIGVGSSTTAAAYLAILYPQTALTASFIAPSPSIETQASVQVYDELLQVIRRLDTFSPALVLIARHSTQLCVIEMPTAWSTLWSQCSTFIWTISRHLSYEE